MKKLLSLLSVLTISGAAIPTTIAASSYDYAPYTPKELAQLKEENKINTTNQEIRNNLEWMSQQEKPFNQVDNKYYFVVWRSDINNDWRIIKFKNNEKIEILYTKILDEQDNIKLSLSNYSEIKTDIDLSIDTTTINSWSNYGNYKYFKAVYRWNLVEQTPDLYIDKDGNIKVL